MNAIRKVLPLLETVLEGFGKGKTSAEMNEDARAQSQRTSPDL